MKWSKYYSGEPIESIRSDYIGNEMHNDFAIDSQILPAYTIAMEFLKQIYTHHLFYCENNFTDLISKLLQKSWVFIGLGEVCHKVMHEQINLLFKK